MRQVSSWTRGADRKDRWRQDEREHSQVLPLHLRKVLLNFALMEGTDWWLSAGSDLAYAGQRREGMLVCWLL